MHAATTVIDPETAFCDDLVSLSEKIIAPIEALSKEATKAQAQKFKALTTIRAERDLKKSAERTAFTVMQEEQFSSLEDRAVTREEKSAVRAFESAVDAAFTVRSRAIDTALVVFRTGLDRSIASWQKGLTTATNVFVNTMKSAIRSAESDCKSGKGTARATFQITFRDARAVFQKSVTELTAIRDSVEILTTTRNSAFDQAQANFVASVNKAVEELRKVFPEA